MDNFFPILYGLFGAVTGSFLNVCILRIPAGEGFITGRSHCPLCRRQLPGRDMVPILSWIILGGRCRFCKGRISIQYPAVESLTSLLFFLCCLAKGPGNDAVILCLFGSLLTIAAWIDARHMYIPDTVSLLILALAACSALSTHEAGLPGRAAGAVLCGGFLALLRFLTKGGVGLGDVKLLAASGALLGAGACVPALLAAYVLAGLWYLIPLMAGRVDPKARVPMAPFFAVTLFLSGLWHREIISWYMGLFLP